MIGDAPDEMDEDSAPPTSYGPAAPFQVEKCHKAKSGYCRDHAYMRPTADNRPVSHIGLSAGRAAANTADLGNTGSRGRLEA